MYLLLSYQWFRYAIRSFLQQSLTYLLCRTDRSINEDVALSYTTLENFVVVSQHCDESNINQITATAAAAYQSSPITINMASRTESIPLPHDQNVPSTSQVP